MSSVPTCACLHHRVCKACVICQLYGCCSGDEGCLCSLQRLAPAAQLLCVGVAPQRQCASGIWSGLTGATHTAQQQGQKGQITTTQIKPFSAAVAAPSKSKACTKACTQHVTLRAHHGCALVERKVVARDAAEQPTARRREGGQHAQLGVLQGIVTYLSCICFFVVTLLRQS